VNTVDFVHSDVHTVSISGLGSGDVRIIAATDDTITGRIDSTDTRLLDAVEVRQSLDRLRIDFPKQFRHNGHVRVEVAVPAGTGLEVETGSGDVIADATLGATKISTGSGEIELAEVADVHCSAGSGDIVIRRVSGSAGQLSTGSGDVTVAEAAADLQVKTASGDVTVHRLNGAGLRANTASGDIGVPSTSGSIEARAASGSISIGIADALAAWLDLNSVTGNVNIDLDPTHQPGTDEPYVTIRAATASGDITVYRA
jgi:DUF4097 and DUF4098 domain-containing protein YvlB